MNVITRPIEFAPGDVRHVSCTQDVGDTLGVAVPVTLIVNTLKVPPDHRRKSACYWTESNVRLIRDKLIVHLQEL